MKQKINPIEYPKKARVTNQKSVVEKLRKTLAIYKLKQLQKLLKRL